MRRTTGMALAVSLALGTVAHLDGRFDGAPRALVSTGEGGRLHLLAADRLAERQEPAFDAIHGPDAEAYQAEIRSNPHRTPSTLMRFADDMATRMSQALSSPERAQAAFAVLEVCADDVTGREIPQVRAICAVNAGRLAQVFGAELGERYGQLSNRLPERIALWVQASGF